MREIRSRIDSVQQTMKITNAMYLISSSKLRKARKSLAETEPYFESLQATISDILLHAPEIKHPYFEERERPEGKKRGYIVITADKGLAGAYNHNVVKLAEQYLKQGKDNLLLVVGQVGREYFQRRNYRVDVEFLYTAQNPTLYRAREISETVIQLFQENSLDEVYIIFTKMFSSIKMEPEVIRLLPLERKKFEGKGKRGYEQIATFWPSKKAVMDRLVPNYLKGLIFGALVEAFSSEQNARMIAMDSATTSAKKMIRELSLRYNRARQASITQEITEIASGTQSLRR